MKRVLIAALLALCVSSVGAQESTPDLPEGPYLPVWVTATGLEPFGTPEVGDSCAFPWPNERFWWLIMPMQIIVRNESDTIISVTDVEPQYVAIEGIDEPVCVFDEIIPLPDASFYGVWINDQYLVTYSPTTLPTDPDNGLYINLGDDPTN